MKRVMESNKDRGRPRWTAFEPSGPWKTADRMAVGVASGVCVSTFMASPSCPAPWGTKVSNLRATSPSDSIRPFQRSSDDAGSAAIEEGEESGNVLSPASAQREAAVNGDRTRRGRP